MQSDSQKLDEEANLLQDLIAHFDVAEFGHAGELQFFPKPVQNSGVQVRSLVQQVKQFRSPGGVLIVSFETARIFDGDGKGQSTKVAGLLVGWAGSNVDSHIGDDSVMRIWRRKYYLKGESIPGRGMN